MPTLILVERIRLPSKGTRLLGGGISITVEEAPDEVVRDVFACYCSLRVLANATAKAGTPGFTSPPLDVNLDYADHALRATLRRQGGQQEMLDQLDGVPRKQLLEPRPARHWR